MSTMSELGHAPETWSLLPRILTLDQTKWLREMRHAKLIECRPVPVHMPTYIAMEWRMTREELRRHRGE